MKRNGTGKKKDVRKKPNVEDEKAAREEEKRKRDEEKEKKIRVSDIHNRPNRKMSIY
jgi:chromatin assembly factor 1 subunit A